MVTRRLFLVLGVFMAGGCMPRVDEQALEFARDGVHLYQQGDYKLARECFEVALATRPEDANLLYNIGQCYDREGEAAKAEAQYRACLARSGNHAPCRRAYALLLCRTGRKSEADRMVQEWLAAEPKLADAFVEDAWRLRQEGDLQKALGRLQQAWDLEPKNARMLSELGRLSEARGLPEVALQAYEDALARDANQPEIASRVATLKAQGVKRPRPD